MRARPRRIPILVTVAAALALADAPSGHAEANLPARFPAAGELVRSVAVRVEPDASSPVVQTLRRFRPDKQFQIVLALSSRRGADGAWWYRLSLPGRPNGRWGWVRADAAEVRPVTNRIVVRLDARRLEVRRVRDERLLLRSVVAIGAPGAETPIGRDFYVESAFVPTDPFFGTFALETSAFSRLTDWPDDGVVGIHGTSLPWLLGQACRTGAFACRTQSRFNYGSSRRSAR